MTVSAIELARKHVKAGHADSAALCLADADNLMAEGRRSLARMRALRSLMHSVGVHHPDYIKACEEG
jgi:hypothetical protein